MRRTTRLVRAALFLQLTRSGRPERELRRNGVGRFCAAGCGSNDGPAWLIPDPKKGVRAK